MAAGVSVEGRSVAATGNPATDSATVSRGTMKKHVQRAAITEAAEFFWTCGDAPRGLRLVVICVLGEVMPFSKNRPCTPALSADVLIVIVPPWLCRP